MLPIVLDVTRLRLILVGNGMAAERRLALLDEAGAADLAVYADDPSPGLAHGAGTRLVRRLPSTAELAAARMVFIAERGARHARDLAATARAAGVLVHVEDEPALCDAHAPATLRRGNLLIAVSTGGHSPALAAQVKRFLGALFGTEWQQRLDELAALRRGWREGGADLETVARWTEEWVGRQGWLPQNGAVGDDGSLAALRSAAALEAIFAPRH
jgi:precorrin-2 dehydrogenase/sirohydrochlorin ferrochelatase